MTRSSYGERDYTFGQVMLTLRKTIGLTQAELAQRLGVSRKAVGEWEAGSIYPKAEHLKAFIALGIQQQTFPLGREKEEIRMLWRAAHQKVLLDEHWLQRLLSQQTPSLVFPTDEQSHDSDKMSTLAAGRKPRVDWGDALDVPIFYGREEELVLLSRWIVQERCRVVNVVGIGGIGKSSLTTRVMHQVAEHFEAVIWRSLRNSPTCEMLLDSCLQVLASHTLSTVPNASFQERFRLFIEQLRTQRVLLVLDNLETLLEEGSQAGQMRAGFDDYTFLLRQIGQSAHQSCLLLTSREKLADLVPLEGRRSPVRSMGLSGLDAQAGAQLLAEKDVAGTAQERMQLVEAYWGNPLALQIVAQTIVEVFGGEITPFLRQGGVVFGGVRALLDEQYARLSALEQTVLCWLAIVREPVSLEELLGMLVVPLSPMQLLEAVDGLRRRSLIERGQRSGSFTLQSVVLEYVTNRLVITASQEIQHGRLRLLREHGLSQANAKEYVRQTQERLLLTPLLDVLGSVYRERAEVEEHLRELLSTLRTLSEAAQGYGPANLVALLRLLRGNLCELDLSHLTLRGVYLQGVEMQNANLSGSLIRDGIFTETFDAITVVSISKNGLYCATGSRQGEVQVRQGIKTLYRAWQAHTDIVTTLAFSPDGRLLATGSWDGSVKLWDIERRSLLWSGWHTYHVNSVTFSPDGLLLAVGGNDAAVQLLDPQSGSRLQTLPHPGPVLGLAWSPNGRHLASGNVEGKILLWERQQSKLSTQTQTLEGHSNWVRGLTFSPDSSRLASGSWDGTLKLWELASGRCVHTLEGHTERVHCVAWSSDGNTLASGSFDHTIRLWDTQEGRSRMVLRGHSALVESLAFTPDGRSLLSGSDDGTQRLWDVERGELLRILQGYTAGLLDIDWNPDGTQIASAGADTLVTLWDLARASPSKVLHGHRWVVSGVAWSPDGTLLASSGWDNTIHLWNPTCEVSIHVLHDPNLTDAVFFSLAWSPDGRFLACGIFLQSALVWDLATRSPLWVDRSQAAWIRCVAWSSDGTRVVGGGDDGSVYVWGASDGKQLQRLVGHSGAITSVAFSPDSSRLASGSGSGEGWVWDVQSKERMFALEGPSGVAATVTWSPNGERLIGGGSDGRLRWWDAYSGQCVREQEAHQGTIQALKVSPDGSLLASCGDDGGIALWDLDSGEHVRTLRRDRPYERLNITGIRGLSDTQKASLRALGAFEE